MPAAEALLLLLWDRKKGKVAENKAKIAYLYTLIVNLKLVLLIFVSNKKSRNNIKFHISLIYFLL